MEKEASAEIVTQFVGGSDNKTLRDPIIRDQNLDSENVSTTANNFHLEDETTASWLQDNLDIIDNLVPIPNKLANDDNITLQSNISQPDS